MNFQFDDPEEGLDGGVQIVGPVTAILIFGLPVFIIWKTRTKIFLLMFIGGLFWIITPFFFEGLTVLLLGIIILGLLLVLLAFKKGYINKKKAILLFALTGGLGGTVFYLFVIAPGGYAAGRGNGESLIDLPSIFALDRIGNLLQEGLLVLILISIFAIGFFIYNKFDLYQIFEQTQTEEKDIEQDISSAVDDTLQDLYKGNNIESTIMRCYQRMSMILEDKGVKDEKYMTPRELEKAANEILDVPISKISRIIDIFELVKYSEHSIDEKDKLKVVDDLKALRDELT